MAAADTVELRAPQVRSVLEQTITDRRSQREFAPEALTLDLAAQLLWAAQGITSAEGLRAAPSAGALYPLELHLVAGDVAGLPPGSYRYDPAGHRVIPTVDGDLRPALAAAALHQYWIAEAPALIVIAAVPVRTSRKYGQRSIRYVHIEAGHAGQNLLLQATALGLGSVVVGAFEDRRIGKILQLPEGEQPIVILPVGHPR